MKAAAVLLLALAGAALAQSPRELESAPPLPVYKVEPQYTQQARAHGLEGVVVLYVQIDKTGKPVNIKVLRGLGMGLDEKAVAAVKQWRFQPGLRLGRPVSMAAAVNVFFKLPSGHV